MRDVLFRCKRFTLFIWIGVGLLCSTFTSPPRLKLTDVRKTMQEMFEYHVDYKEFTNLIARRSLKIYMEQFDPEKKYLLSSEALSFLSVSEGKLEKVVQQYQRDDFSEYASENRMFQRAINRARKMRAEVEKELIAYKGVLTEPTDEFYVDYAQDEKELKGRIRNQLIRLLLLEKQWSGLPTLESEDRARVFALWEKRLARYESPYLASDFKGETRSKEVQNHYLTLHILKALARSLDAHTAYFSPEEAFEMRASLEKQFEGIGIVLREGIYGVVISDLIKGGPADKSGQIQPGDLIININGEGVEGASYEEILQRLHGHASGRVKMGLQRKMAEGKGDYYEVELKKEKIVMEDERLQYSFEPYADGIIVKMVLPSFYESGQGSSCEKDMREALQKLKKEGTIYGIVLDLRENLGGFLNQAVKVAGLFITSGVIVISKYAHGEIQYLRDIDGRKYYDGPLVILTSKASASAAEIVAQALQDYGVALVIGDERTYGKGSIQYQTITDLKATNFFKVTVGRYYTVSGRSTQIDGVQADIVVPTMYSAYNIGEKYLEYALKRDQVPAAYNDALMDVDPRNQPWFQRHYVPFLQQKLSVWHQMLPDLQANSARRLAENPRYQAFLQKLEAQASQRFMPMSAEGRGEDLQMDEAVNVLKDMIMIQVEQQPAAVGA